MPKLIEECYLKSINLLLKNSTKSGFLAATPGKKASDPKVHYNWIFGRDASICSLGVVTSGNKKLLITTRNTLTTLAKYQSKFGQIPNAISVDQKKKEFYFASSVDSTMWWLIALNFYSRFTGDKKLAKILKPEADKAIIWLMCQTSGETNLIEQSLAGDWADLMPRSGHVLYSNVLWLAAQKLYKLPDAQMTESGINTLFYPFSKKKDSRFFKKNYLYKRLRFDIIKKTKPTPFYLSHVDTFSFGRHCDVFANVLALLLDLPDKVLKKKIIDYLIKQKVNKFYPVQVLTPPIKKSNKEWGEAMERNNLNKPYEYHNGGIWPYVGGFWVIALKKAGKEKMALQELEKLAEANKINNWQFNEWFHGKTGKPMGMPGQSWNAGTFLLAYHCLQNNLSFRT